MLETVSPKNHYLTNQMIPEVIIATIRARMPVHNQNCPLTRDE